MADQVLEVRISEAAADGLSAWARVRRASLEQVAAEALEVVAILREQDGEGHPWTEEDLAAIRRGVEQADRGDLIPQAVLEREIDDLLR
jgi:predicted transcriptional regulator